MTLISYFKRKFLKLKKWNIGFSFPIFCKIHGVSKEKRQGSIVQCSAGDKLQIVHVPLKDYPHNLYVYNIDLHMILGYLDEALSKKLIYVFGQNFCVDGEIVNVTGGEPDYKTYGCNIRVFETRLMMIPFLGDIPYLYGLS